MRIGISPFSTHFKSWGLDIFVQRSFEVFDGNFLAPLPVISPTGILYLEKYSMKDSKCCSAKISVGAMYATCKLPNFLLGGAVVTAAKLTVAATAVLPEPTSPSRSRDIGWPVLKSLSIAPMDFS